MKDTIKETQVALVLDKDDERNPSGMQIKVWKLNKETAILVRLLKHDREAGKEFWDSKETAKEADDSIMEILKKANVVKDVEKWTSCSPTSKEFEFFNEAEAKENCFYLAWIVKPVVIHS